MTSLNPLHTIERQIGESLALHQGLVGRAAAARIVELLTQVGIRDPESRLGAYPHQLSGGQRQRVMIAMALANNPDILIADEPTTALDVTIQAQILTLLADLQRARGMGMLFITHNLGIVRRIADRVAVMQGGEIVETGPTAAIFAAPRHPYTRKLLAAEPTGRPDPVAPGAPTVVETERLRVWFPIRRGLLRRTVGHVKAVNEATLAIRAGETLGVVGESGSGKTTLALATMRLISSEGRDRLSRPGHPGLAQQAAARPAARHADGVPGPLRFAEPAHVRRADRRRGARGPWPRDGRPRPRGGDPDRGRPRSGRDAPLSARVLRRTAPAHRHRPRDDPAAEAGPARRADLGARHDGAGADRRSAAGAAAEIRARLHLRQPRPARGAGARPQGHRHAERRRRRGGRQRGGVRRAEDRLHPGADGGGVRRRRRRRRPAPRSVSRSRGPNVPRPTARASGACPRRRRRSRSTAAPAGAGRVRRPSAPVRCDRPRGCGRPSDRRCPCRAGR